MIGSGVSYGNGLFGRQGEPFNDEKVFALHPEWRDWVAKIHEMQLKALKEPNDGDIDIGLVDIF